MADRPVIDIMTERVFTVEKDSWVIDAARIMVEYGVSGLPVTDGGNLVGIINETDLISREIRIQDPTYISFFSAIVTLPWDRTPDEFRRITASTVGELMTHPVYSIKSSATVRDVATLMFERKLNPVPVLDDDENVIGIVSRSDIIRLIVESADVVQEEDRDDGDS